MAVAIVALPLAIAFGITATGTSQGALIGLYGAIFAGFFAAVFGGTPGQVTGPTGPITVVATATIAEHGLEGAFFAFILAGVFQILFGACRLGSLIRYVPHPVIFWIHGGNRDPHHHDPAGSGAQQLPARVGNGRPAAG